MENWETGLRLMIIGQLLLVAIVILAREPKKLSIPLSLLKVAIAAYVIKSSLPLRTALDDFHLLLIVASLSVPYLIWWSSYALFDFERPPIWLMVCLPLCTAMACLLHGINNSVPDIIERASLLASLIAVLHAVYSITHGSLDDLYQPRRRFRFVFAFCTSAMAITVLTLELIMVGQTEPAWLTLGTTVMIGIVLVFISVPLLSKNIELIPDAPPAPPPEPDYGEEVLDLAEQQVYRKLMTSMENRGYARTGMTIRHLAEELDVPEHHLRKLINQRLGYRNFSTFLNGYRVKETCERLKDPQESRIPILTIALDAGFASLAPFNRAFRQVKGITPSEFRKQQLRPDNVTTLHG